jgi:hypothetical protein
MAGSAKGEAGEPDTDFEAATEVSQEAWAEEQTEQRGKATPAHRHIPATGSQSLCSHGVLSVSILSSLKSFRAVSR